MIERQCTLCGRKGTRAFTMLGSVNVCTFTRACRRRRAPRLPRRRKTLRVLG